MSTPVPPTSLGARARFMPFFLGFLALVLVTGAGAGAIYFTHFRAHPSGGVPALDIDIRQANLVSGPDGEPLPEFGLPDVPLEQAVVLDVERDVARAMNDAVPISDMKIVPARPFASRLVGLDRDRARTCLALAAIYEAGSNVNDQRPVMQVVLNRVRHPAFPNSVCEVVFQGAERRTGCQFSFTCDGSMARNRPPQSTLSRTKGLAEWMLSDGIDQRVGHATHYHTDWVVPYWSPKLNKLTQINTHIFLGWPGFWGKRQAFNAAPLPTEGQVPQLASYAVAHSQDDTQITLDADEWAQLNAVDADGLPTGDGVVVGKAAAPGATKTSAVKPGTAKPTSAFFIPTKKLGFEKGMTPGRWALNAAGACGDLPDCRVVGWSDPAKMPGQLNTTTISQSPPDLVFVQALRNRIQTAYWDCSKWSRAATSKCLGSSSERVALVNGTRLN